MFSCDHGSEKDLKRLKTHEGRKRNSAKDGVAGDTMAISRMKQESIRIERLLKTSCDAWARTVR
jgi:hypothetical protein